MSRELTASWLRQNIVRYQNSDRLYTHVLAALDRYPSLRPKTDVYTFDDGRTQLLLCIHGLLPISFRNASYNIPIALWLVLSYPADAPLVYVVPTSDMLVRPSAQVDHSGKCSIDYTAHWSRKPEACSLVALLEAMQSHFSNEPPLYSKSRPKPSAGPPPASSPAVSSPSTTQGGATQDRGHVNHLAEAPPPPRLPPKPFSPGLGIVLTPGSSSNVLGAAPSPSVPLASQSSQSSATSLSQTQALDYSSYTSRATNTDIRASLPPVPPHPSGPSLSPGAASPPAPSQEVPRGQDQNAQGPPPYASAHPPIPPRPAVPPSPFVQQSQMGAPLPSIMNGQALATVVSPPHAASRAYTQLHAIPLQPQASGSYSTPAPYSAQGYAPVPEYRQSPAPPTPRAGAPLRPPPSLPPPDLLDEDDDQNATPAAAPASANAAPPPPHPPNPQTVALHSALQSSFRDALSRLAATHTDGLVRQRAAQAELLAAPEAIRDESARLTAVRDVCRSVGDRWDALITDGERALGEVRRHGEVGVDEMVCASSIVGNQLVNLVAEDNAIEDTMYHLHRALNSGRIDLERFLRTTRVLAEEQFMKRALAEKILRGLPVGVAWTGRADR